MPGNLPGPIPPAAAALMLCTGIGSALAFLLGGSVLPIWGDGSGSNLGHEFGTLWAKLPGMVRLLREAGLFRVQDTYGHNMLLSGLFCGLGALVGRLAYWLVWERHPASGE